MPDNEQKQQVGRLAIRAEGDWINAYWAKVGTMEGAVHLASIRKNMLPGADSEEFRAWTELLQKTVTPFIEATFGVKIPLWGDPYRAPEHERSGSA